MNILVLNLLRDTFPKYVPPEGGGDSGIYVLFFKGTNKFYVGSCKDFKARVKRHLRELEKGQNKCGLLQCYFDNPQTVIAELIEHIELPWEREKFFKREEFWINSLDAVTRGLNITSYASGGDTISDNPDRDEIIKAISTSLKAGISKLSQDEYNVRFNVGAAKYISNPEQFSEIMRGIKTGENHHFYGKHLSAEHKAKLKLACDGSKQPHAVKCEINGVLYNTLSEAERQLGIGRQLIKYRCKSKTERFSNWKLIALSRPDI